MKKLILILALIAPVILKSQSTFTASSTWTVSEKIDFGSYISVNNDGSIEIKGDTMNIIKYLLKIRDKQDSVIEAKNKVIRASVKLINNIETAQLKNNCYWRQFDVLLNKEGYKTVTFKKPKQICTNK